MTKKLLAFALALLLCASLPLSALAMVPDEGDPFVSVLDDDDFWDTRYLQNCLKFAEDVGCDMVVSGLIRHDVEHPEGFRQSILDSISIHDFLVGNPGVQGSNLFVRASRLRSAGGFSEDLVSTTDRDVCIRLLQGGIRVADRGKPVEYALASFVHDQYVRIDYDLLVGGQVFFFHLSRIAYIAVEDEGLFFQKFFKRSVYG